MCRKRAGIHPIRIFTGRAALELQVSEVPALGAIFQRIDRIRYAEVDQRLRADDRTRAPRAINDDLGVGIGHHRRDSVGKLCVGAAGASRNGHPLVLAQRTAIEDHKLLAGFLHAHQILRRHARRMVNVLDEFTEELAWNVDALEQRESGGKPAGRSALEDGDACVAKRVKAPRGERGDVVPGGIAKNNTRRASRDKGGHVQLEPAVGKRGCEQQMRFTELACLTDVEKRDLGAIAEHIPQSPGGDGRYLVLFWLHS